LQTISCTEEVLLLKTEGDNQGIKRPEINKCKDCRITSFEIYIMHCLSNSSYNFIASDTNKIPILWSE